MRAGTQLVNGSCNFFAVSFINIQMKNALTPTFSVAFVPSSLIQGINLKFTDIQDSIFLTQVEGYKTIRRRQLPKKSKSVSMIFNKLIL